MLEQKQIKQYQSYSQEQIDTSFRLACVDQKLENIKFLIESKELNFNADIHHWNDYGFRRSNNLEVIKYFLENGVDPYITSNSGILADTLLTSVIESEIHNNQLHTDFLHWIIFEYELKNENNMKDSFLELESRGGVYNIVLPKIYNLFKMKEISDFHDDLQKDIKDNNKNSSRNKL